MEVGDLVRVSAARHLPPFVRGKEGAIVRVLVGFPGSPPRHQVRIEHGRATWFYAHELKLVRKGGGG
jgi:hypothetical protein